MVDSLLPGAAAQIEMLQATAEGSWILPPVLAEILSFVRSAGVAPSYDQAKYRAHGPTAPRPNERGDAGVKKILVRRVANGCHCESRLLRNGGAKRFSVHCALRLWLRGRGWSLSAQDNTDSRKIRISITEEKSRKGTTSEQTSGETPVLYNGGNHPAHARLNDRCRPCTCIVYA